VYNLSKTKHLPVLHNPVVETSGSPMQLPRPRARSPRPGDLLLATPSVSDTAWRRTVVLLLTTDAEGAIGVVLNRRAIFDESELPDWVKFADDILIGGPVSPTGLIGLAASGDLADESELISGIRMLDLDRIEAAFDAESSDKLPTKWRLFAGYAGWDPQQLSDEIERGDWAVVAGMPSDVLEGDPEMVWNRVLSRQRSSLRLWTTLPDVPDMN
jgi:putative transcriptional regulator